jgi:hypothetical protein
LRQGERSVWHTTDAGAFRCCVDYFVTTEL